MPTRIKFFSVLLSTMLLATCGGGGSASTPVTPVTPVNAAPVANAGLAQSVLTGTLVTLDGSASTDANNDALTYSWSLTSKPAGSGAALLSPTAVKPTFTADVAGTYVAALTVSDGKLSSSAATVSLTATSPVTPVTPASLTLSLPARAITASQLAVIVAAGDPLSEAIASYYQTARGIPAANVIRVTLATGADTISATEFAALKTEIDAKLPGTVQATLLTWTAPSRVVGSCAMSITSALALGFDAKYCANSCASTAASPYFDSESAQPWVDHKLRPSMMLGASTLAAAKTLIDRGVQADASLPTGDGYLLRTSDVNRSVRYTDYAALPSLWAGNSGLQLSYIDNSAGAASDGISGKSNVLFYFTGLAGVPPALASNSFRPGAMADSLTSTGGYLPGGNGQMPITSWLDAGATASYGTVEEPCNYTQKFSKASVLIDQYYRGATLIEAYWKSVQWPGQGLFVGEPLAQPFRDSPGFSVDAGQYLISTRSLRANSTYTLQYQITSAGSWVTLGSFKLTRAQPQSWRVSLPPGSATQLRWLGPCPANAALQCTLSTSP
ncbi:MAG: TIGR03790 family protein [Comamonadaceae bacterium]